MGMTSKEYHEGYQQGYKDAKEEPTTKNDLPKYCDRNICLKNEYNNVGCEDCEVTKSQESTTKNDLRVEKIIDEIEKEFEKVDIPIMDKLTLFAKVQNALYECAVSDSEIPNNSTTKNDIPIINGLDDFIAFGKKAFGVELAIKKSDNPDTYEKLFGTTKNDLEVDCIDRAELLKAMDTWDKFGNDPNEGLIPLRTPTLQDRYVPYVKYDNMVNCVKSMPSVTLQEPRCKECKWWKDSDGTYRRGIGAESRCPINHIEVLEGNGYCFLFEPQESE